MSTETHKQKAERYLAWATSLRRSPDSMNPAWRTDEGIHRQRMEWFAQAEVHARLAALEGPSA